MGLIPLHLFNIQHHEMVSVAGFSREAWRICLSPLHATIITPREAIAKPIAAANTSSRQLVRNNRILNLDTYSEDLCQSQFLI